MDRIERRKHHQTQREANDPEIPFPPKQEKEVTSDTIRRFKGEQCKHRHLPPLSCSRDTQQYYALHCSPQISQPYNLVRILCTYQAPLLNGFSHLYIDWHSAICYLPHRLLCMGLQYVSLHAAVFPLNNPHTTRFTHVDASNQRRGYYCKENKHIEMEWDGMKRRGRHVV